MKYHIQEEFVDGKHFAWCSEYFNPQKLNAYSAGALVGSSSSPARIYRNLREAVETGDEHSPKINSQKATLKGLTREWRQSGTISEDEKHEIFFLLDHADFKLWRPLLYLIPREPMSNARIQLVPPEERASSGKEYVIEDLSRDEFDIIELPT